MEKFEDESLVRKIESDDDGVKIYIGNDNNFDFVRNNFNHDGNCPQGHRKSV